MRSKASIAAILCVSVIGASLTQAEPITTGTLVHEMIDMRRLSEFPDPAFKTVQFSSYDRRSNVPGGPGWFANSDGFGKEPIPNFEGVLREPEEKNDEGEYLICDVKGPGAIVRVWTARMAGTIRLYLDGSEKPVFEGPSEEFLQRTWYGYAHKAGIENKVLNKTFRQREAGYYPIPFAKGCRITWTGQIQKTHFYQVQIRVYEPSAQVVTFQPNDLKTYKSDIEAVAKVLANPGNRWLYRSSQQSIPIAADVPAGDTQEILTLEGPKAIERLTLKVTAQDMDRALRQTILRIKCDGYLHQQVECPIGDFFGAAPGINPYNSVPFTVEPDGTQTCRFVMPFKESINISLENRGNQPISVIGSTLPMDYDWNDETSMHFRARWRVDHNLVAYKADQAQDIPFLIARGQGVYVGSATILLNPAPIPAGGGSWWGEGDEKIFVDDDILPSTFGTGSEDYYNYAWSSPDIFVYPYCAQPRNDGPVNRGFVTNNRWHILDPLPFQDRIAFYMELYAHDRTPHFSYARIGYHYGRPGLMDDHLPITHADVRHLELPPNWQPEARRGASNSVFYQAENLIDSQSNVTFRKGNLFAGGRVCIWQPAKIGDELALPISITEDGKYFIRLAMLLDNCSGTFSATLDGKKAGFRVKKRDVINLFRPHRTLLRLYASDHTELNKGKHQIVLRYEGPAAKGVGRAIGIDFIAVRKK